MKLINIKLKKPKITSEEKHLKKMSTLPFMNTLLEKISHIKNTNLEFKGKYINISTDTKKLSMDILSFQYKTELNSLKMYDDSIKEKSKHIQKILNDRVTGWYSGEKITTPAAIIYREIDKICVEKKIIISTKEKEKILDIVNKKHMNIDTLEKKASVSSMLSPLKSDKDLDGKINVPEIKKKLIMNMKQETPEQFKFLVDDFHKYDAVKQKEKLLTPEESIVYHDIPIVREISGKIISDVYGGMTEEIYNILFRDTETEQPLDFDAIKVEARMQAEIIAKDKKTSGNNEISSEDIIRQKIKSKIKINSSSSIQDLENLLGMLNRGEISDQRSEFNPGIKVTSSYPEQDIEDLFEMLNKGEISDQRYELKNKL